jgi:hypothetical protein
MSKRRLLGLGIGACGLALIGFLSWSRTVRADAAAPAEAEGEEGGLTEPVRRPFEPYPADPGALAYESLSATPIPEATSDPDAPVDEETYRITSNETRDSVDQAEEWAQTRNGYAVHQRWSAYSRVRRAAIEVERAEREAGLAGMGEVGVE